MSDEIQRCACGGSFGPNLAGAMTCHLCGAPMAFNEVVGTTAEPVWNDIGKTLGEVLAHRHREALRRSVARLPTDNDVRVT
jgi:hypothetical protein